MTRAGAVAPRMAACRCAYREGREAHVAQIDKEQNPYHSYGALAAWWDEGWDDERATKPATARFRPHTAEHRGRLAETWAANHGLRGPVWTPELEAAIIGMHERGLTHGQIAIKLRKTRAAIKQRFRYLRLGRRNQRAPA